MKGKKGKKCGKGKTYSCSFLWSFHFSFPPKLLSFCDKLVSFIFLAGKDKFKDKGNDLFDIKTDGSKDKSQFQ